MASCPASIVHPAASVGTVVPPPSPELLPRRVECASASDSQYYRACLTSLTPVFTSRCCRLVSDQFPIIPSIGVVLEFERR